MATAGLIEIDRRWGAVSGSMLLSVLLHGLVVMVLLWTGLPGSGSGSSPVMSPEDLMPIEEEPEKKRLGLNEAQSASIDWLGIERPEAVEGEAELSDTNQAAQTLVVGNGAESAAEEIPVEVAQEEVSATQEVPPVEQADESLAESVTEPVADPLLETVTEAVVDEPLQEEVDPALQPVQQQVIDERVVEEQPVDPMIDPMEVTRQEGIVVTQEPAEPNEAEQSTESVAVVEQQIIDEAQAAESMAEQARPPQEQIVVTKQQAATAGEVGVLSRREVVATRIKKAIPVDPHTPNAPVVGKGLEIITVRPRYTSAIRLSAVPTNPIVVMWFDARGRVAKAEFLKDGRKVYSSGVVGVDEPLLNAIYRWRAKGAEIEALDPSDPRSLHEVSIKIIYQRER